LKEGHLIKPQCLEDQEEDTKEEEEEEEGKADQGTFHHTFHRVGFMLLYMCVLTLLLL
jgi:hypothetical protein